jgi:hypothetical protein
MNCPTVTFLGLAIYNGTCGNFLFMVVFLLLAWLFSDDAPRN